MALPYQYAKRFDDAIALDRKAIELESNFPYTHSSLGWDYLGKQMYEEALKEYKKALDLSGGAPSYLAYFASASALAGRKKEAVKALEDLKALSKTRHVSSRDIASVHIALGEPDQALQWLEQAYEKRDELLMFLKVDWAFDPLRSAPRFQALLDKMKFPEK
jgi:tetratricopeptide (TPR) repeat protein